MVVAIGGSMGNYFSTGRGQRVMPSISIYIVDGKDDPIEHAPFPIG
ncbi:hypothetical protein [Sphingomonas bisphenolicum]|uniref:Uncharacterized protein n=1 Tax=Sphingomonas bisphenolicum TaxID=296544 RepID=A0ABN5WH03_9SPHN|nr:hypothetical protein [Sphingomonas bisphenolicum]BBF71543.1 hypothetical protein SBA_ch2_0760 [Sphingomonas bisphenolicum]